jgi:LPS-assembly protein
MSKRGLMSAGEYRFLGQRYRGSLFASYLNDDKEDDRDRWAVSYFTDFTPAPRWDAQVYYNRVSDKDYLTDFGDSLRTSSRAQLDQSVRAGYRADNWRASLRYQKYQNVDKDISKRQEPYERLPEFNFLGRWPGQALGLTYELEGSYNQFEHEEKVDGGRLYLYPTLSLPLLRSWGYLNPRASLSYAHYRLRENDRGDNHINRALPVLSMDTGIFFDRPLQWGNEAATQTLEPRLFYLYAPKKGQNEIPLFDTSNFSTNYDLLFRENRFTGPDRIGDANQLTLALTTRFMVDGDERVGFDIGQIRFFRDRKVTARGSPATDNSSDIIAQGRLNLKSGVGLRGSLQWDPDDTRVNVGRADLRYNPEPGKQLNLFYRFDRGSLKQVDVSGFWPLTRQWKVMARSLYSLDEGELVDAVVGLEYESCCWAIRIAGRQFRNGGKDSDLKSALFMELELKGLAGIGNDLTGVLEDAITGYESNR